jgi:hypothetical protein
MDEENTMKNIASMSRAAVIAGRIKQLTTLALVAGSAVIGPSLHAVVQEPSSVSDRVAKIRHALAEITIQPSSIKTEASKVLVAQWGNSWTNWNNWKNWQNWNNWVNWLNF